MELEILHISIIDIDELLLSRYGHGPGELDLTSSFVPDPDKLFLIQVYWAGGLESTRHSRDILAPLSPVVDDGSFTNTGPSKTFLDSIYFEVWLFMLL